MIYSEYGVRTCFETSRFAYACSREPWVLTYTTDVQKTVQKGRSFLVYPLGVYRYSASGALSVKCRRFAPRANRGFSPLQRVYKKPPKKGGFFWCTRWGSNPNSTASEAVMLSNYTTSTYKVVRLLTIIVTATRVFYYSPFPKKMQRFPHYIF